MNLRFYILLICSSLFISIFSSNYYVKVAGAGNGTSWESAMSFEDFVVLLPTVPDNTTFHVAEGTYYVSNQNDVLTVKSNVSIIGGYSSNPSTGDISQPDKYKAILDGSNILEDALSTPLVLSTKNVKIIIKGFLFQNDYNQAAIKLVNIYSLDLDYCIFDNNRSKIDVASCISASGICQLKINNSTFKNSQGTSAICVFSYDTQQEPTTIDIINSSFENNITAIEGSALYLINASSNHTSSTIENCFFYKNGIQGSLTPSYYHRGAAILVLDQNLTLKNNTFLDNYNETSQGSTISIEGAGIGTEVKMLNNTIIDNGNRSKDCMITVADADLTMIGNLIVNRNDHLAINYNYRFPPKKLDVKENIFTSLVDNICDTVYYKNYTQADFSENNIFLSASELSSILDGTYSNGIFTPNIKDNGGFTPTIALTGTNLPGCKSIKMVPTAETGVTTDQRGVQRAELACVGAYENTDATEQCVDTDIVENVKDAQSVVIYPNPTHDLLYWQNLSVSNTHFLLYSINGTLLLETDSNPVDLSLFDSGLYLIRIGDKNYKIIKQ